MKNILVIIPAFNEEDSIAGVLAEIPAIVKEIIVVDNNSTDKTSKRATEAGATVLFEKKPGYGNACLCGMEYVAAKIEKPDIIVFLDGDHSDYPAELQKLVTPIIEKNIDFVIGARNSKLREKGSMTFPQLFGNRLATTLMKILFKSKFTDLGPFRAIKYDKLLSLHMEDKTYGWTVEMQLKALRQKLSYTEVKVKYRCRSAGESKVSGTLKGAFFAGVKILSWIFKYSFK